MKKIIELLGIAFATLSVVGFIKKPNSVYKNEPSEQNPFEGKRVRLIEDENDPENADGVRGHLESIGTSSHHASFYEKYTSVL